jgi:hypothetical protein
VRTRALFLPTENSRATFAGCRQSVSLVSLGASWTNCAKPIAPYTTSREISPVLKSVLKKKDLRMAEHHLRAEEWHAAQAKQRIAAVGQVKVKAVN